MQDPKLVRVQDKGQVTIPQEIRKKLGLKQGDLVAVVETPDGVFITPQQVFWPPPPWIALVTFSRNKASRLTS